MLVCFEFVAVLVPPRSSYFIEFCPIVDSQDKETGFYILKLCVKCSTSLYHCRDGVLEVAYRKDNKIAEGVRVLNWNEKFKRMERYRKGESLRIEAQEELASSDQRQAENEKASLLPVNKTNMKIKIKIRLLTRIFFFFFVEI
jgi:hypothetical protein